MIDKLSFIREFCASHLGSLSYHEDGWLKRRAAEEAEKAIRNALVVWDALESVWNNNGRPGTPNQMVVLSLKDSQPDRVAAWLAPDLADGTTTDLRKAKRYPVAEALAIDVKSCGGALAVHEADALRAAFLAMPCSMLSFAYLGQQSIYRDWAAETETRKAKDQPQ